MMLIDTNILLSLLLGQNDHDSTKNFFSKVEEFNLNVTILDFSLYTVCLTLSRRGEGIMLKELFNRIELHKNFRVYRLNFKDMLEVMNLKTNLKYDDKLHYYIAKTKNLTLISYDKDFDKTDIKCLTPAEALADLSIF